MSDPVNENKDALENNVISLDLDQSDNHNHINEQDLVEDKIPSEVKDNEKTIKIYEEKNVEALKEDERINEIVEEIQNKVEEYEKVSFEYEESRDEDEESRVEAEESRKEDEESRGKAEESRGKAEESRGEAEESRGEDEESRGEDEESKGEDEESRNEDEESRNEDEESRNVDEESRNVDEESKGEELDDNENREELDDIENHEELDDNENREELDDNENREELDDIENENGEEISSENRVDSETESINQLVTNHEHRWLERSIFKDEVHEWHDVKDLELQSLDKFHYHFYYKNSSYPVQTFVTTALDLPDNTLELYASLGYDCQRTYNLIIFDLNTIGYMAGNYIVFYHVELKRSSYMRCRGGTGLSALNIDAQKRYFAVGERGENPQISVYHYPSLNLMRVLEGGTERSFSYLEFNFDGTLLASLGGTPDFTLAIWDWVSETLNWKSKAFGQDVYKVLFSCESSTKLFTAGMGHIKFWTMADTFTGCKLQGALGKFDQVEISDIKGLAELPGDRVVTSCDWGNMLLWEDGVCVAEVSRSEGTCHKGCIQQITNDNGSILTLGTDGYIRVWDMEERVTERNEDELRWVLNPLDEIKIGKNSSLMRMGKVDAVDSDVDSGIWMIQDTNGSIWMVDLSFQLNSFEPREVLSFHAGAVYACIHSPLTYLLVTSGADCTIRVFDYLLKKEVSVKRYNSPPLALLWLPTSLDKTAALIAAGFQDGVVRLIRIQEQSVIDFRISGKIKTMTCDLALFDVIKPHNRSVTSLKFNASSDLLVSGSLDMSVFFFRVSSFSFVQLGFVVMSTPVTHLTFSDENQPLEEQTLLVSCRQGNIREIKLSDVLSQNQNELFKMIDSDMKEHKYKSVRHMLLVKEFMLEKATNREEKKADEADEKTDKNNLLSYAPVPSTHAEEEEAENDGGQEEDDNLDLPPPPETDVLFAYYGENGKFWVSMDDFDKGFLCECSFEESDEAEVNYVELPDCKDIAALCHLYNAQSHHCMLGLEDGRLLIYQASPSEPNKFTQHLYIGLHDGHQGGITGICCSHDNKFIITVGLDGNIFVLRYNLGMMADGEDEEEDGEKEMEEMEEMEEVEEEEMEEKKEDERKEKKDEMKDVGVLHGKATYPESITVPDITDIVDTNFASIEVAMLMKKLREAGLQAQENKDSKLNMVAKMQRLFRSFKTTNLKLPPAFRLHPREFLMDKGFEALMEEERTERKEEMKNQMAFETAKIELTLEKVQRRFTDQIECDLITIRAFGINCRVASYRYSKFTQKLMDSLYNTSLNEFSKSQSKFNKSLFYDSDMTTDNQLLEDVLEQADDKAETIYDRLKTFKSIRLRKLKIIEKMEFQKRMRKRRRMEWAEFKKSEPRNMTKEVDNEQMIVDAKFNLGDMKLKLAVSSKITSEKQLMTLEKSTNAMADLLVNLQELKGSFNEQLLKLRDDKDALVEEWQAARDELKQVQQHIPLQQHKQLPSIDVTVRTEEHPESAYTLSPPTTLPTKATSQTLPQNTPHVTVEAQATDENDVIFFITQRTLMHSLYKQDKMVPDMQERITLFDNKVLLLMHIKFSLDVYVKQIEIRELLLLQELMKMLELIKEERVLVAVMAAKKGDEVDMKKKIDELVIRLERSQKEWVKLTSQLANQEKQFLSSLPEACKFKEFLLKVYKQKGRRKAHVEQRNAAGDEEEDEDEDEEDEDEDEDDDENIDDDDDNYLNLDVCPEGCNIALFERTNQMREARMDLMDKLVENKKVKEQGSKDLEIKRKVIKTASEDAAKAAVNLDLYHVSKLKAVNEFYAIVVLVLKQVEISDEDTDKATSNVGEALVVDYKQLKGLENRIQELQGEWKSLLKTIKESQEKHVLLMRSKAKMMATISEAADETCMTMEKKFGKEVDMEKLESILVTPAVEELMHDLNILKTQQLQELNMKEQEISTKHSEYMQELKVNTDILNYSLAYKDLANELASELDKKEDELTKTKRQLEPLNVHLVVELVNNQLDEIIQLKREMYRLLYCTPTSYL